MSRVAIYARYSSDNQREASIEDQIRLCRERADREGWTVVETYADHATSGASLLRPGIQSLIKDAVGDKFNVILAEAMDRLSRDQEDIAGVYKRMTFAGVKIVTLSEGEITHLHVGLKGTMNALFLQDLADKTRRGLRGRVEAGRSGGGNAYGYDVVRKTDAAGNPVRGERTINEQGATVVRRIFEAFAAGKSPLAIATALNMEGVASPSGKGWGQSTINGNPQRGTGILNNELYVGRLIWNRLRYMKDPDTGRRISRLNPELEWIVQEVPDLRIVEQELWDRVKVRQAAMKRNRKTREPAAFRDRRRPRFLLSGLVNCGACGGVYTVMSKGYFGCSTRHNKGTCDNSLYIRHDRLEATVLGGLKRHLIQPESFAAFCKAFTEEINCRRIELSATQAAQKAELEKIGREIAKLIEALKNSGPAQAIVTEIQKLEARQAELESTLADAKRPAPLLHPNMARIYQQKLERLYETLEDEEARHEAATILRSLIDRVVLMPVNGKLMAQIEGDLAGILGFMSLERQNPVSQGDGALQLELVAGAGFEPATFRL